jgi:hypothetical protein
MMTKEEFEVIRTKVKTKMVWVTPEMATGWLEKLDQDNQRKFIPSHGKTLANSMRLGHYGLNHQGIAFNDADKLIDGQHRLQGVVESGVAVPLMVTWGLPEMQSNGVEFKTISTIDRHRLRSIGQILQMEGWKNGNRVAAAIRCVMAAADCYGTTLTTHIAKHILIDYGTHLEKYAGNVGKGTGLRSSYFVGAFAFCRNVDRSLDDLYQAVVTGENIHKGMPAYVLREYLLSGGYLRHGGSDTCASLLRAVCTASYHYIHEVKIGKFKPSDGALRFFVNKQKACIRRIKAACGVSIAE